MKKLLLKICLFLFTIAKINAQCTSDAPLIPTTSQNIDRTFICGSGITKYYRTYELTYNYLIFGDYLVSSVDIGIDTCRSLDGNGQTGVLNLYSLSSSILNPTLSDLSLLHSQNMIIPDQNRTIHNIPITSPVIVPSGSTLVVEIYGLNASFSNNSKLFIGFNNLSENEPGYIVAPGCGYTDLTNFNNVGLPDGITLVMNVHGCVAPVRIPTINQWAMLILFLLTSITGILSLKQFNYRRMGL